MYNATKYLRLSYTSDRANESDSIANQRKYIDEFVKRNPDIRIVNERVDDGYSGIVFDRPAFKAMIDDIKNGRINCVIVKDLSRLGREYNETFTYLRKIFPSLGVRFIAINDNVDTAKESVSGDLSVSFKGVMNVVVQLIECIHIYDKTHLQITFNFKDEYEQALSALKEYVEVV